MDLGTHWKPLKTSKPRAETRTKGGQVGTGRGVQALSKVWPGGEQWQRSEGGEQWGQWGGQSAEGNRGGGGRCGQGVWARGRWAVRAVSNGGSGVDKAVGAVRAVRQRPEPRAARWGQWQRSEGGEQWGQWG